MDAITSDISCHMIATSFVFLLIPHSLVDNAISNKGAKALSRALLVNRTLMSLK